MSKKASEFRKKTASELRADLKSLRRQQFKLRLVKASGELGKTHDIRIARRDIARIETILTEKEGKRDE